MNTTIFRTSIIILSLALTGFTSLGYAQKIPLDPSIKTGKLANGFTYFIRKNQEPQNRATLYLVLKAGSILEKENQLGLAHFMEHMSFNGTKHFPKNELVEYLQKSGIRFGADLNAYTGFDETVYQLPIPTDDNELFNNGMQIMRDWAAEATLDINEINKERGVVLEEKRLRKGVGDRLQEKLLPFQFNNSRYANRLPIGTEKVLTTFKKADILSFYKDWYRPDLEALIVVGDIDVAAVEKQIKILFADLKAKSKVPRSEYKVALLNKNRFISLTDPEIPQISMEIDFKTQGIGEGTKQTYRTRLLRNLCSQLLAERLNDLSKTPAAPVLNVQGGYQPVIGGIDALSVEFTPKEGRVKEGFNFVYGAILQIKKFGFTETEIARVKKAHTSQLAALLKEKDKQNSTQLADELKRHFLTGEAAPGIAYENKLTQELLPTLTPKVINAEIAYLLTENNRDIILTGPAAKKASLPSEATVNNWLAEARKEPITAYAEKQIGNTLLGTQPIAGKVISEITDAALGTTIWKLSNGATVVLKPTTFKNDEVLFHFFSHGGTSLISDADFQSAANAAGIIASSGLGAHDAVALPKLLTGKQLSAAPYIGERSEGLQGGSTKADLETAMQLAYLYFTEPRKDSAMFSKIVSSSTEMIANRYANPQAIFQDTVAAVLGNYNERRTGPSLDKLNSISLEKGYAIYKERFADAGDFTFVFTGSFTPAELKPIVEQYIASLPGGGQAEQAKGEAVRIPRGDLTKKVYAGKEDKASVTMLYSGNYTFSPEESLKLKALSEVIQFKMTERLRETEGGAYSPSAKFQREHVPDDRYQLVISFGCAPANVDKLIAAAEEEIEKLKANGPSVDDMQKFKSEEGRQLELSLQNNGYWLSYLSSKLQNGEELTSILIQSDRIKAITAADIQDAAKKYLGNDLIKFILLPEVSK